MDKRVDPTIGTVAATRVRSRYDVLILRPFPLWLYQRKPSDGPQLLLQQLRGANIDWPAYRESRKPCVTCSNCQQIVQVDSFTHEQWEHARANMPALCTACKIGYEPKRKRKLHADSLEKFLCIGCDRNKIADAFPRAQLVQAHAETQRQCLKCLQVQRTEMQCRRCSQSKTLLNFAPQMVTMPLDGILCLQCQEELQQQMHKLKGNNDNFFTCLTCSQIHPAVVGTGKDRSRRCINCASRSSRKRGEQTCRNAACKRKWIEEEPPEDGKRPPRYCPACRR